MIQPHLHDNGKVAVPRMAKKKWAMASLIRNVLELALLLSPQSFAGGSSVQRARINKNTYTSGEVIPLLAA